MWKDYSSGYIKHNRASGISILVASFIAAFFLSFLCSLFYNFWLDNIESTKLEAGDWQGRIIGEISEEDLTAINHFANVEKAVVNEQLSGQRVTVVDVYFNNKKTIYQDMSALAGILGLTEDAVDYNYQLLSLYFIRIPGDTMPRLLMPAYLIIVVILCFSLILMLHNAFAVSMNNRIHQFGIFSSIGATPGQIRACLVQEAFMLAIIPIFLGLLLGIALSFVTIWAMITYAMNLVGGRQMSFGCHPVILLLILLLSFLTVLISAWLPARKLSKMTPLEAIRGTGELQLKRKKRSRILSTLFGMEGELAGNALKAQKKALRTTSLSLTFAFLGFMLIQCFFTLSGISTNHTYFEAYQDVWDVMVTVKDTKIEDFMLTEKLREVPGSSSIVYQKAEAVCLLPREAQSQELLALGGLEAYREDAAFSGEGEEILLAEAPIFILDDESFREFCGQVGIMPRLDGTIVLNRFWDSKNSNFRYPAYIPYIKEDTGTITLQNATGEANMDGNSLTEIPVLACTQEMPLLREEYAKGNYGLVQFMPLSLWEEVAGRIGGTGDTYIRVLADHRTDLEALRVLEEEIGQVIRGSYEIESENRIQEKLDNDKMIGGYKMVLGAFCVLVAIIGVAHVFSNTLGFLNQRKREFARYVSVGLTSGGIRKIFLIEALLVVGRPMLFTLLLTMGAVWIMITASYLNPVEFIAAAPIVPIFVFILAVFGCVALAYYLGGKKLLSCNLIDALKDDAMM